METIRQGDVALVRVKVLPKDAVEVMPSKDNKIILAFGEATGHHHRIENVITAHPRGNLSEVKARLWTAAGERFLQVLVKSELQHEEHSTAYLEPGIYQLPIQVEYTPAELVRVTD